MASELRMELKNKDTILRKSITHGQGPARAMIENLESQVEIEELRAQDLTSEMTEYMEQNVHLRDQLAKAGKQGSSIHFSAEVEVLKSELESERKYKLMVSAQQYDRANEWVGELNDKDQQLKLKQDRLNTIEQEVYDLKIRNQVSPLTFDPYQQSFSAGMARIPHEAEERMNEMKAELQKVNDENTVLRAWNRQLDDALTGEMNAAQTSDQSKPEKSKDHNKPQSSTLGDNYLKDINTEATTEEKK